MCRWPAAVALWALAACAPDFTGASCRDCGVSIDAAMPGDADAAPDLCAEVICDQPPGDGCMGDMVATYTATGECNPATGECVYTPNLAACDDPPFDECDDDTLVDYPDDGVCAPAGGDPRCEYEPVTSDCTAADRQCQGGACVDPCQGNPCNSPPAARCTGPNLHTFASPGTCTSPGGVVDCAYAETTTNCAAQGQVCSDEAGTCVDP
jgi:hypothetical protein